MTHSTTISVIAGLVSYTQRQIHTAVFGGKSSVKGATSGTASSVAFTPLQVSYKTQSLKRVLFKNKNTKMAKKHNASKSLN